MPRYLAPILVTMALLVMFCGHAAFAWYPYGARYTQWQKSRPMLFAGLHNSVPRDRLPERIARFKAAGLNTFIWAKPGNAHHFFRTAHEANLAWACWSRGGEKVIAEAMKIPGNAFIMIGDEPSDKDPEEIAEIAGLAAWVRETYPDTITFTNLSITKCEHDAYIRACHPDLFSFDHYPLQRDGATHDNYLYDLAWGRQTAMRHRLPYWIYLQSYGRVEDTPSYAYRNPDEADIRFLVFTFLAHGGTGIQWFMYYGYEESMVVDARVPDTGRTPAEKHTYEASYATRAWFAIRDVAPEVQALSRVMLNLRPTGEVGYVGNGLLWDHEAPAYSKGPVVPFRSERFTGHGALRSIEFLDDANLGAMVGLFDDAAGEAYFMVVNLQHGANMSKMDGLKTLRLVFDPAVEQIERLNRLSGRVEVLGTTADADRRTLDVRLEGGTGDLFKWSNGKPWALR